MNIKKEVVKMEFSIQQIVLRTFGAANKLKLKLVLALIPVLIGLSVIGSYGLMVFDTVNPFNPEQIAFPENHSVWLTLFIVLLAMLFFMKAIINCHRVYILEDQFSISDVFSWRRCDTFFLKAVLKLILLSILVSFVFLLAVMPISMNNIDPQNPQGFDHSNLPWEFIVWGVLANLFYAYMASRLTIMLPAAATNNRLTIRQAWQKTRPFQLKLFVLIGLIPFLTSLALNFLPAWESVVYEISIQVIWVVIALLELGLLSMSYARIEEITATEETAL
jgi:hypothetical protein